MILVTGATGLNGSAVIREFATQGVPARALVRDASKAEWLRALPGIEVVEGDMLQPDTLKRGLQDVDRALLISSASPQLVETQTAFIQAAKKAGVRHVVKFSGITVKIGSPFRYFHMHGVIEAELEKSGLTWTHLSPGQFMQMYFREVRSILSTGELRLPMENATIASIDVADIAKIAFRVLTGSGHEGKRYEMTGPEALTMAQVAERISVATGRPVRYVNVSPAEMKKALLDTGAPPYFADALDELFAERRKGVEARVILASHKLFGIRPTTFAEFAARNARVFRGEAPKPP